MNLVSGRGLLKPNIAVGRVFFQENDWADDAETPDPVLHRRWLA